MSPELEKMKAFCLRTTLEARALGFRGAIVAVSIEKADHSHYWVEASGPCLELEGLGRRIFRYVGQLWKGKTTTEPMRPHAISHDGSLLGQCEGGGPSLKSFDAYGYAGGGANTGTIATVGCGGNGTATLPRGGTGGTP